MLAVLLWGATRGLEDELVCTDPTWMPKTLQPGLPDCLRVRGRQGWQQREEETLRTRSAKAEEAEAVENDPRIRELRPVLGN